MSRSNQPYELDVPFVVPQVHRLRFTDDVLGADQQVLLDLLVSHGEAPARVQFWVDEDVLAARPGLEEQLLAFSIAHSERIERIGPVQKVPGGEAIKNDIHILERMLKVFNVSGLDRRSYVVVFGGGAVLDAVGFAASIAHRGLRLVRLPTTTLGQADSGVGVKNGVNLFGQKNWVGSFHVPWAVVNDTELLASLSQRDFICGFAEAVKVALLKDAKFFEQIEQGAVQIAQRETSLTSAVIRQSAVWHLKHITQGGDPFENREARPLDFGHWSAHKLETMSEFSLRHGEAVALGVAMDTAYSMLALGFPEQDCRRVWACLERLGFSLNSPFLADLDRLFAGLEEFRQHLGGRLTLTMLRAIGRPVDVHQVDRSCMCQAIEMMVRFSRRASTEFAR